MDINKVKPEGFIKRFFRCLGHNTIEGMKILSIPLLIGTGLCLIFYLTETEDFRPVIYYILFILIWKSIIDAANKQ